jgi:tetratricopeptide (TPR) repeat protein
LQAWWDDDQGNRALQRGHPDLALGWFDAGLAQEPDWALLHEDRGRALLHSHPQEALAEFDLAACGSPCDAEAGDALAAMGRRNEAIERYIRAKAVTRLSTVTLQLAREGRYDSALSIESALLHRLHNDFIDRADLATVYDTIGQIEITAAIAQPKDARSLKRAASAISAFANAMNLAPLNENYLLSYGFAQLRFGDRQAARATFERLLQLHPGQPDALAGLEHAKDSSSGER